MRHKNVFIAIGVVGIVLIGLVIAAVCSANRQLHRSATSTAQALLRLHKEYRPAVFSSNIVVFVSGSLANGAPVHSLPMELQQRNPLVCVVTSNTVDVRCVIRRYMFQTNISDRWVLERDAHDIAKWSLFELHGFWGRRGPVTTIAE